MQNNANVAICIMARIMGDGVDRAIFEALQHLIKDKGEVRAAALIGVSQATINRWRRGISQPRGLSLRSMERVLRSEANRIARGSVKRGAA